MWCSDGFIVFVRKTCIHTAFWSIWRSKSILKLPLYITGVSTQWSVFRQEFSLQLTLLLFHSPLALAIVFLRCLHLSLLKFKLFSLSKQASWRGCKNLISNNTHLYPDAVYLDMLQFGFSPSLDIGRLPRVVGFLPPSRSSEHVIDSVTKLSGRGSHTE